MYATMSVHFLFLILLTVYHNDCHTQFLFSFFHSRLFPWNSLCQVIDEWVNGEWMHQKMNGCIKDEWMHQKMNGCIRR